MVMWMHILNHAHLSWGNMGLKEPVGSLSTWKCFVDVVLHWEKKKKPNRRDGPSQTSVFHMRLSRSLARPGGQQYTKQETGIDMAGLERPALALSSHRHPGPGAKPELRIMVALCLGGLGLEDHCPCVTTWPSTETYRTWRGRGVPSPHPPASGLVQLCNK